MSAKVDDESEVWPLLALMRLLYQHWRLPAIEVAIRLGIADVLGDGTGTLAELAEATGAHGPSLYRLLRALARIGIFVELDGPCFANSEMSQLLRVDVPGSVPALAAMTSGLMGGAFGGLLHSMQTGQPGFDQVYGMPMWRYLSERDPLAGAQFNAAMTEASAAVNLPIAQAAELSGVRSLVDIGGGQGGLLTTVLATYPEIEKAILFDQPRVIEELQAAGGSPPDGRLQVVGGDFFTAVPAGADVYVMKWILHDWDDATCLTLLSTCRRAMTPRSRLLVVELVIDPRGSDELAYALDLQMLVALAGQERTAAQFGELYEAAGLRLARIIPTASMFSLIEGIPLGTAQDRL